MPSWGGDLQKKRDRVFKTVLPNRDRQISADRALKIKCAWRYYQRFKPYGVIVYNNHGHALHRIYAGLK